MIPVLFYRSMMSKCLFSKYEINAETMEFFIIPRIGDYK